MNLSDLSNLSKGGGNVKTPPSLSKDNFQSSKYKGNYHLKVDGIQVEQFEQVFNRIEKNVIPICDLYIFGEEYGEDGVTPHIEFAFTIKNGKRMRRSAIKKLFEKEGMFLDKMRGTIEQQSYCKKEGHKVLTNIKFAKPLKIIKNLYPYQQDIVDMIKEEPNDRDIIWIYGHYNIGKTQISKYLDYHKLAKGPLDGDKRHILSVIAQHQNENCWIIYLTADESKYQKNSFFDIIEKVKDGFFMTHFGTKLTDTVNMNSPHILIFANERPDFSRTMMDPERFKIFRVEDKKLVGGYHEWGGTTSGEESESED